MNTRETTLLNTLEIRDIRNLILKDVDLKGIQSIALSSKEHATFFSVTAKDWLIEFAAKQLMKYINQADWDRAEKLIKASTMLVFTPVLTRLVDGQRVKMSPFQKALYLGDYHSLVIIQSILKEKKNHTYYHLYHKQEQQQKLRLDYERYICDDYMYYKRMHEISNNRKRNVSSVRGWRIQIPSATR
jgi:hypothetical protein